MFYWYSMIVLRLENDIFLAISIHLSVSRRVKKKNKNKLENELNIVIFFNGETQT